MAGRYGRRFNKDEDFEEEQVWGFMEEKQNPTQSLSKPRMIPKSTIVEPSHHAHETKQFSAPLDIPDWSKIYGNKKKHGSSSPSWAHHHHDHDYHDDDDDDGDGDGEDEDGVVPPHEYLAKKLARSQISSFSVCEGIGRTLKGRDLSKVRTAVLTRTGFLES